MAWMASMAQDGLDNQHMAQDGLNDQHGLDTHGLDGQHGSGWPGQPAHGPGWFE